ncbi:hypothetical protein VTL71DRAFT_15764 [Oculimacula yallundae]|uniref:Uncharacterized protein n=1 Tax=Oculimacula yallundae TaxID=86028 RepID=A0ABR4CCL8_9HELO
MPLRSENHTLPRVPINVFPNPSSATTASISSHPTPQPNSSLFHNQINPTQARHASIHIISLLPPRYFSSFHLNRCHFYLISFPAT